MANLCAFKKANLPVFYLIGGPSCGKNTQADKLKQKFGYSIVNMGKLLRTEVKTGSCRGNKIKEALQNGDIAPQDATVDILKEALVGTVCAGKPIVIVGFPRNKCQKKSLEKEIGEARNTIFLDVSNCTMKRRQQARGGCSDRPEVISRRMEVYQQQTRPMIDEMVHSGRVIQIDGEPQADQVFYALSKVMECQNSQLASMNPYNSLDSGAGSLLTAAAAPNPGHGVDCDCPPPPPTPCQQAAQRTPCGQKPAPCGKRQYNQ